MKAGFEPAINSVSLDIPFSLILVNQSPTKLIHNKDLNES